MHQSCTLSLLERIDDVTGALMDVDGAGVDGRVRGARVHGAKHSSGVLLDDAGRSAADSAQVS